jgi:hypothetical protein
MELHIDVPWILQVAEIAGAHDPAPDDYGVPVAAVAAHRTGLLEQPVYDGPYARAAALVHILGRCRWLERSTMAVAAATGVMYLEASDTPVKPTHQDAVVLRDLLREPTCTTEAAETDSSRLRKGWCRRARDPRRREDRRPLDSVHARGMITDLGRTACGP